MSKFHSGGRIWPHMAASAGVSGGMRVAGLSFQETGRILEILSTGSTRPAPRRTGAADRSAHSAGPIPKTGGLVHRFFGIFVIAVCAAVQAANRFAKWLFGGVIGVLRASREQLGCEVGCMMGSKGPS